MTETTRELVIYETLAGKEPFTEWVKNLRDRRGRAIIHTRLDRLQAGNDGNLKSLGEGIFELKIDFGPGYRVYFGLDGKLLVILLCGGDKDTQARDVGKALEYWIDYRRRKQ